MNKMDDDSWEHVGQVDHHPWYKPPRSPHYPKWKVWDAQLPTSCGALLSNTHVAHLSC